MKSISHKTVINVLEPAFRTTFDRRQLFNSFIYFMVIGTLAWFIPRAAKAATDYQARGHVFDFYFENYKLPSRTGYTHFERIRMQATYSLTPMTPGLSTLSPYIGLENYQAGSDKNDLRAEIGFMTLPTLSGQVDPWLHFLVGLQGNKINVTTESRTWLKAGIYSSKEFRQEANPIITDYYAEVFQFVPDVGSSFIAGGGFIRGSYRLFEKNHWIFDPAVLEFRGTDNTNNSYAGPDYMMINLGPKVAYWSGEPEAGVSLFVAKSWVWSKVEPKDLTDYWILISAGARF